MQLCEMWIQVIWVRFASDWIQIRSGPSDEGPVWIWPDLRHIHAVIGVSRNKLGSGFLLQWQVNAFRQYGQCICDVTQLCRNNQPVNNRTS